MQLEKSPLQAKSVHFAVESLKIQKHLSKKGVDKFLINQFIRCSTSVGTNIQEAIGASSSKDFSNKLNIAYKEARESHYWLVVFFRSELLESDIYDNLEGLIEEIEKMLFCSIATSRKRSE